MINMGINFTTVTGNSWYFTKEIVEFLNDKGKSWIFTCKGNKRLKYQGR